MIPTFSQMLNKYLGIPQKILVSRNVQDNLYRKVNHLNGPSAKIISSVTIGRRRWTDVRHYRQGSFRVRPLGAQHERFSFLCGFRRGNYGTTILSQLMQSVCRSIERKNKVRCNCSIKSFQSVMICCLAHR